MSPLTALSYASSPSSAEAAIFDLQTIETVLGGLVNYADPASRDKWLKQKNQLKQEPPKEEERDELPLEGPGERDILLYNKIKVVENSREHLIDAARSEIVDDPDFKKKPPEVNPEKLAILMQLTGDNGMDPKTPCAPDYLQTIKTQAAEEMARRLLQEAGKGPEDSKGPRRAQRRFDMVCKPERRVLECDERVRQPLSVK